MKNKKISRKDFIKKTGKCVGGIICIPMAASIFQSCSKPELIGPENDDTLYISVCPCHNAQFDQNGSVLQGPSDGDQIDGLQQYTTTINDNSFTVSDSNGNEAEILFSDHESLQSIGGISDVNNISGFDSAGLLFYRKSEDEIIALSRVCTHEGCQIGSFEQI